ncbi:MAG: lysoplasmalogenase [Chloroflexi bacterium]|nr:lysoplasmalogenase [Chloroflexota bacterium]
MITILSILALITAVLAIRAEYLPKRTQLYLFKPLTTLLIIRIAFMDAGVAPPLFRWLILVGLIFCLGGDVFLMLPAKYFIAGLVSFLIGHIFYIVAFISDGGFHWALGWFAPLIVYGSIIYRLLHPHLGKLRGAVIVYILAILTMAWQALGRWTALETTGALLAAAGAVLFVISDSVLALDRFRQKFASARVIVLSTYWIAQWLIAFSTHF